MKAICFISLCLLVALTESCLVIRSSLSCTPNSLKTYYLSYSNDIDRTDMWALVDGKTNYFERHSTPFDNFCFASFDIYGNADVHLTCVSNLSEWHSNLNYVLRMTEALNSTAPGTPSNAVQSIEKFLSNTATPICGAKIVILSTRPSDPMDTRDIVTKLQNNHIFVFSATPEDNNYGSDVLGSIASQTNGYGTINAKSSLNFAVKALIESNCVYSINIPVSGVGSITLPILYVPYFNYYAFVFSTSFKIGKGDLGLTWNNSSVPTNGSLITGVPDDRYLNGNTDMNEFLFESAFYEMELSYDLKDSTPQSVSIRVYTFEPITYWVPYDNLN